MQSAVRRVQLAVVTIMVVMVQRGYTQTNDLPEAFKQVIPRGTIAAISQPQFVTADRAEVADESWMLGVVIDGQARAYSLSLLNRHEVVNDQIGDSAFAAVW